MLALTRLCRLPDMKKTIFYVLFLATVAGCAVPVTRLSGTGAEWWDAHKNRKVF